MTDISFEVPAGAPMHLRVNAVSDRLVRTLVNEHRPSATSSVTWNGENDKGQRVASGTSYDKLETPTYTDVKKMVLLKYPPRGLNSIGESHVRRSKHYRSQTNRGLYRRRTPGSRRRAARATRVGIRAFRSPPARRFDAFQAPVAARTARWAP